MAGIGQQPVILDIAACLKRSDLVTPFRKLKNSTSNAAISDHPLSQFFHRSIEPSIVGNPHLSTAEMSYCMQSLQFNEIQRSRFLQQQAPATRNNQSL